MTGVVLFFLIVAAFMIMYFIMKAETKNLRKANIGLLQANKTLLTKQTTELKQLKSYLTQDPIGAFQLLKAHVESAEKTRR